MIEPRFYVYVLFRLNGTPCYVGKGSGPRWKKHYNSHNLHLRAIVKKDGELIAVKVRVNLSECEAFEVEKTLIATLGREQVGGLLVNLTDGGEGVSGHIRSLEMRERDRFKAIGKSPSEEARARMSAAGKGRPKSAETKAKMSVAARAMTPEHRKRISAAKLGKARSLETREKIKQGLAVLSEEARTKWRLNMQIAALNRWSNRPPKITKRRIFKWNLTPGIVLTV